MYISKTLTLIIITIYICNIKLADNDKLNYLNLQYKKMLLFVIQN